jgi:hypothetical protein
MPDKYAETLRELLRAKVEQRAPEIEVASQGKAPKEVINIMAALKESMQAKGRATVRDAVRRWASLSRKGRHRLEPHDRGRARVGRRIRKRRADKEEPRSRGDHDRGTERKWREGFRLLKRRCRLRDYSRLVVPEATSHSDCSRNDNCASK